MANRQNAIMRKQYSLATENPHPYLKFYMDEANSTRWYVLISGCVGRENEFEGGEYLVRIEVPPKYPLDPPHFYFMTPQGLYGTETKVCVSIGEYHKENYRAVLGIVGFCENLVSGLIGWESLGHGIAILNTNMAEKKKLAAASREYNTRNNQQFIDKINSAFADYSKRWTTDKK